MAHEYMDAQDKEKILNRLRRIEGQVRGIQRMVEKEDTCVDILTQISSIVAASDKVATLTLEGHVDRCLREPVENEENADEIAEEIVATVERFLKLERTCA